MHGVNHVFGLIAVGDSFLIRYFYIFNILDFAVLKSGICFSKLRLVKVTRSMYIHISWRAQLGSTYFNVIRYTRIDRNARHVNELLITRGGPASRLSAISARA